MIRNLTSELAVNQIGNRYHTVLIAAARMRELAQGEPPLVPPELSPMSTALREIELGLVGEEVLTRARLARTARPPRPR
jgi:DNA-directed RNA polymerase omega subunit